MASRLCSLALSIAPPFALVSVLLWPAASSAFDVFVKIDSFGGCGTAVVEGFQKQIEARGFAQAVNHPTDASGLPGAKDFRSIKMIKFPDGCTPKLFLALLQDQLLPTLTASFVQPFGGEPRPTGQIDLTDAVITNMTIEGTSGTGLGLNEVVELGIQGTLRLKVFQYDDAGVLIGTQEACWNFKKDSPC